MIVYLRVVPGFWVAVEEAQRPELRSRPLIVGGLPHQRGVVREVNGLAQDCGVRPGMTLAQAHQQCPHGVFLMPQLARYELVWEEICEILRRHAPLVEPIEMGQAVCDMSGCERFWADERSAGRAIARQIERSTGVASSIGMASNRSVAQLASMFTAVDGVAVIARGQERAFLADLPLALLPGVDPHLALTFQVLGLTTIGQFAALPSSAVRQRFRSTGEQLHRYARGIDSRPVLPPPEKSSIVARYECEDGSIEEAMDGIRTLADTCAGELQGRGTSGRLIGLTLIWVGESRRIPSPSLSAERERGMIGASPPAISAPQGGSDAPSPPAPLLLCGRGESWGMTGIDEGGCPRRVGTTPAIRGKDEQRTLPIPYRVHSSRLPQPSEESSSQPFPPLGSSLAVARGDGALPAPFQGQSDSTGRLQEVVAMVRTPINTAPPLLEQAQRLLLQLWPNARSNSGEGDRIPQLLAIELKIGEFTKPAQLSFSDFDRLQGGGGFRGFSAERRQALVRDDDVFEARYGTTAFQHVAAVDSENILTERRFRWEDGLPWNGGEAVRKRS